MHVNKSISTNFAQSEEIVWKGWLYFLQAGKRRDSNECSLWGWYRKSYFDANPAAKGHVLILPKEHFDNIYELDDDTAAHVFKVAAKISKAYKKALDFDGLNIVQNNGEVAGQTVFHFHMHIIPRIKGDTVKVGWVPGTADTDTIASIVEKVTPYL